MFGDIGHGSLLFLFSVYLNFRKPNINKPTSFDGLYEARYILLLMGCFSVFSGFIYNDFFGFQIEAIPSCFIYADPLKIKKECAYPFGIDPVWSISSNELAFLNSLKMKLAIIFGLC